MCFRLSCLVFMIVLASCSNNGQDIQDNPVETDINFYPKEIYLTANSAPSQMLRLETIEIYPCQNYSIQTSESIAGDVLNVRIISIDDPTICLTALGPASRNINFPENIKQIHLINGNIIDTYEVNSNKEKIEIKIVSSTFTNLLQDITFKYPENTFAYIGGTNVDNEYVFTNFLAILKDSLPLDDYIFDGSGVIPYTLSSSGHWKDNPSIFFKYENEFDFNRAGALLKEFSEKNISPNDGVSLTITNWKNTSYHSWQ